MFQDDDDDVVTIDGEEPTCSTFNSSEHAYSYGEFFFYLKTRIIKKM